MYYDEVHLTASGKGMWLNLCVLVDAVLCYMKKNNVVRLSLKKKQKARRESFRQQKLNGFLTSTSSSLIDLNQFPTDSETEQNHLQLLSSSCFIPADSETKTLQNLVLTLMAESEERETKDPQNPNSQSSMSLCLTENTSRKRRAVEQRKRTGGVKKAKVAPSSGTARETPEWLVKVMRDMKEVKDAKLIFEKTLFVTDVNPTQNRLSMPFNNLIRNDFLTSVESIIINEDINNNKKIGVGVILVDQRWNYNLICGWIDVVDANGLKDGDNISLWSFRCCGVLCFAMELSSSSLALCVC
ncbi:hypothetical protein ARALYDRAFT_497170 [Arabidopsis lyrata subsp. lyrata]|uniref:TF-B3 domain-containing protein n=1 Tax=Arabidopsis lyrata subsp. lyrata TaxID=81972 RepID=D7MVS9_ARALL|nr:hypothetical protein ARALYDRAFT_497170 [Arabidopsis lyrata subsp. lyrata]